MEGFPRYNFDRIGGAEGLVAKFRFYYRSRKILERSGFLEGQP